MDEIVSKLSLKSKVILMTLLFFCNWVITENAFSRKHWDRDLITISYDKSDKTINITCLFVDFEFGPRGEHGYLEWGNFSYFTDGLGHNQLFKCQYKDRDKEVWAWVEFRDKMIGAKINFVGLPGSESSILWTERRKIEHMMYFDSSYKICFRIKWHVPSNLNIKHILFTGNWCINGLNCSDKIVGVVYPIQSDLP